MRNRSLLLLAMMWTLVPAASAAQADVAGDWDVTFHRGQESVQATMTLEQDGESITGVIAIDDESFEIRGTINGSEFECEGLIDDSGELIVIALEGVVEDQEMAGAADFGGWGAGEWIAKRQ